MANRVQGHKEDNYAMLQSDAVSLLTMCYETVLCNWWQEEKAKPTDCISKFSNSATTEYSVNSDKRLNCNFVVQVSFAKYNGFPIRPTVYAMKK